MAGIAGTLGMLAEASGTGAELDVAPSQPDAARMGEWLTCSATRCSSPTVGPSSTLPHPPPHERVDG